MKRQDISPEDAKIVARHILARLREIAERNRVLALEWEQNKRDARAFEDILNRSKAQLAALKEARRA